MFLLEVLNIRYKLFLPENVRIANLFIIGILFLLMTSFFLYLFKGFLKEDIFILYDHSSFFYSIINTIVLIGLIFISFTSKVQVFYTLQSFALITVFMISLVNTLQGIGFVVVEKDLIFIKNGRSRNIFKFRNGEIHDLDSNENLVISNIDQEVSIKKNIIIEYEKGGLEKQIKNL